MATTRIMPLHTGKGRSFGKAISSVIDYVSNPDKTENGQLITDYACNWRTADAEFALTKQAYLRKTGRIRGKDDVIAYHFRQSFVPGEITAEKANAIGVEFAKRFTKGNHAFIVCTHTDKAHVHNHIIWSAVNIDADRKFRNFWGSTKAVRALSDTLCLENKLSVVENPAPHGKSYNKWLGDKAAPSHREQLRRLIDGELAKHPSDFAELLQRLQQAGCTVAKRGKAVTLRLNGWAKPVRLGSLGDGYSQEELCAQLAGESSAAAGKRSEGRASQPMLSMMIDIQEKLNAGKGPGYERWAKIFNVKQMAQTVNYLTEHKVPSYEALKQQADDAVSHYHDLSEKIHSLDERMAEISALRRQIIEYAKTRDTYVRYQKSGYSKRFLAEHEAEILLHKAAKKAFEELQKNGGQKIPTVRSLMQEYDALRLEKSRTYSEYTKARKEMKQLLIAKANMDTILNLDADNSHRRQKQR